MIQVGNSRLDPVIELEDLALPLNHMQTGVDPAVLEPHLGWLAPDHWDGVTGCIHISHHAWVVRTPGGIVLVDPCVGNGRHRPTLPFYHELDTPFLERLAATGVRPEEVDFVVCTHLHVDHVGWNTQLKDGRWVPTFPNARYIFSRREHDFWAQDLTGGLPRKWAFNAGVFADSVRPIIDAGLALLIDEEAGHSFAGNSFSLIPTPGHTIGHMSAVLDGGDDGALFCGDVMHWPAQILFPDWRSGGSYDDDQAIASRMKVLELCADKGWLLATQHFRGAHACRIERTMNGGFEPRW
jgi:glyoxylase-like metal-dependent hydrolase (beta-lactamase superfamily II)